LAKETSAYLLQHAHNPVDWYPWGQEALDESARENKPLLVSIGYSSCHWCHVMERESFENAETAALMNRLFVCIKVDREERPDVDQIYMDTVVRLTGHGGWPLTVFCKPGGSPFYGGTYYPDEPRQGMPSFRQVLTSIANAYHERRGEVDDAATQILAALAETPQDEADAMPGLDEVRNGARQIMQVADHQRGGFGQGPKFPTPTNIELLLVALDHLPEDEAPVVASHLALTAQEMARRGLYDHLAGGFHRYCVDGDWTIPHFEKMLYDQGLLLRCYAELARRSPHDADLRWPIIETARYLRREMTSPEGGFFASQDADADGVEGAYNVWTREQIQPVLGAGTEAFCQAYGVTPQGNFEDGTTHLVDQARKPRNEFAAEREALRVVRDERVAPDTDRKRVAAWNGYVISGLARSASALGDASLLADARAAMDFVMQEMIDDDGRVSRVFSQGRPSVPAFLDDHAALLDAGLDLYRAGAGEDYLTLALHLASEIEARFFEPETGQLYFTPSDGERLVHRPRTDHDGATPSALGLAALGLVRLAQLSGLAPIAGCARAVLASNAALLQRAPHVVPTLLRAVALEARGCSVAVIIGEPGADDTEALASRARVRLLPDDAIVVVAPGQDKPTGVAGDFLSDRTSIDGRATAYVCHGTTCSLPITDPEALL
jgi:uncharacterized protein YyaL (SSP411 family)